MHAAEVAIELIAHIADQLRMLGPGRFEHRGSHLVDRRSPRLLSDPQEIDDVQALLAAPHASGVISSLATARPTPVASMPIRRAASV